MIRRSLRTSSRQQSQKRRVTTSSSGSIVQTLVDADAKATGSSSPNVYEQVKPVLSAMGKNIIHCEDTGTGQIAKICNNLVLGVTMAAVAEAMSLGAALGIDPKLLGTIINTSAGRCWSSDTCNPCPGEIETAPASRGYTGGFAIDLMLKDLGLATNAAKLGRQPVYLAELAQQLYRAMTMKGAGRLDFSSVIKLYVPTQVA